MPSCDPVPAPPANPPAAANTGGDQAVAGQLDTVERDLAAAAARLATEQPAVRSAAAAARGTKSGTEAWVGAQLALTSLDRIGSDIAALRSRLDETTATLAAVGEDNALRLRLEQLAARSAALQADYDATAALLR